MSAIFTITGIVGSPKLAIPHNDKRCFGYYFALDEALKAVAENRGNLEESYYDYIVIESFAPGVFSQALSEQWFEWNESSRSWVASAKPNHLIGVVNYALS